MRNVDCKYKRYKSFFDWSIQIQVTIRNNKYWELTVGSMYIRYYYIDSYIPCHVSADNLSNLWRVIHAYGVSASHVFGRHASSHGYLSQN